MLQTRNKENVCGCPTTDTWKLMVSLSPQMDWNPRKQDENSEYFQAEESELLAAQRLSQETAKRN